MWASLLSLHRKRARHFVIVVAARCHPNCSGMATGLEPSRCARQAVSAHFGYGLLFAHGCCSLEGLSAPWFVLEIADYQEQWVLFTTKLMFAVAGVPLTWT